MVNPRPTSSDVTSLSIGELCERAGVTPRRVRYYVQRRLLPPPTGRGRAARYGEDHVYRLEQIKPYADQGMSARLIDSTRVLPPANRSDEISRPVGPDTLARQQVAGFIQILVDRGASPLTLSQERELLKQLVGHCQRFLGTRVRD
jgi:DNA-binding transcriptional MerR regulator